MATIDELAEMLVQARELVRQSHEAAKDLRAAIRESKELKKHLVSEMSAECQASMNLLYEAQIDQFMPLVMNAIEEKIAEMVLPIMREMQEDVKKAGDHALLVHQEFEESKRYRLGIAASENLANRYRKPAR